MTLPIPGHFMATLKADKELSRQEFFKFLKFHRQEILPQLRLSRMERLKLWHEQNRGSIGYLQLRSFANLGQRGKPVMAVSYRNNGRLSGGGLNDFNPKLYMVFHNSHVEILMAVEDVSLRPDPPNTLRIIYFRMVNIDYMNLGEYFKGGAESAVNLGEMWELGTSYLPGAIPDWWQTYFSEDSF